MTSSRESRHRGELSADAGDRLDRFAALLLRWNATLNLIAPRDAAVLWERHITDSLQLLPLIPPDITRAVDLGTGGGFPGLVLSIAAHIPFELIESDRRKAAFLRTAIAETGAPATVHASRIQDAAVPPARLVTARALAPLPRLLSLSARLLTSDGICLFLKGAKVDEELAAAEHDWSMRIERIPSRTSLNGVVLRVNDLRQKTS